MFEFMFKISLHIVDINTLQLIQSKLGIGKVSVSGSMASYIVRVKKELKILIYIFDQFPLNSTKHLKKKIS